MLGGRVATFAAMSSQLPIPQHEAMNAALRILQTIADARTAIVPELEEEDGKPSLQASQVLVLHCTHFSCRPDMQLTAYNNHSRDLSDCCPVSNVKSATEIVLEIEQESNTTVRSGVDHKHHHVAD